MEEAYDAMDPPCQAFLPPAADVDEVLWSDQDQKQDVVMDLFHCIYKFLLLPFCIRAQICFVECLNVLT